MQFRYDVILFLKKIRPEKAVFDYFRVQAFYQILDTKC